MSPGHSASYEVLEEDHMTTQCPASKPAESFTCESLPIGHNCDDDDQITSNDQCTEEALGNVTCTGTVHLASSVTLPMDLNALSPSRCRPRSHRMPLQKNSQLGK